MQSYAPTLPPAVSPSAESEWAGGWRGLRFEPVLEAEFVAASEDQRRVRLLFSSWAAISLLACLCIVDYWMVPDVLRLAIVLTAVVGLPLCLGGAWALQGARPAVRERIGVGQCIGLAVLQATVIGASRSEWAPHHLAALLMVVLHGALVQQLRFRDLRTVCAAVMLVWLATFAVLPPQPLAVHVPLWVLLTTSIVFTLQTAYSLEHDERRSFLHARRERELTTSLVLANTQLKQLSLMDALTGLPNRRQMDEHLAQVWERARRGDATVSLLMIDVDHFKAFNDHHGHLAGDRCLREVAQALQATLRRPLDLVARFGGEEFVAVLDRTPISVALQVAERVRQAVEARGLAHGGMPGVPFVTLSVGVASARASSSQATLQELVSRADDALYRAKQAGRNRVEQAVAEAVVSDTGAASVGASGQVSTRPSPAAFESQP